MIITDHQLDKNDNFKQKSQIQLPKFRKSSFLPKKQIKNKLNKKKRYQILNDQQFMSVTDQIQSRQIRRNTFIFGILMFFTQIAICIVYGLKFKIPPMDHGIFQGVVPIVLNMLVACLVIIGIGLLFGYLQKGIWTALGFNLFICSFTIEIYFIVNNIVNRIGINSSLVQYSQFFQIYLYNFQYHVNPNSSLQFLVPFGNTLLDAFKASLSNCIIYSCIMGRAGILQAYIVTIIGTIGYQFSRQILMNLGVDFADSNSIFTFAGFCGLIVGLILGIKYRRKDDTTTRKNPLYTANLNSVGFSLMGCALLVVLFPTITLHLNQTNFNILPTILGIAPYSIYISTASSILMAIGVSISINGKINIRDFINGSIAGSIAGFCSSFMLATPVFSQIVGATAGLVQVLVQNFIEKKIARKYQIITTYSFCLFGLQGFLGAVFATIFKKFLQIYTQSRPHYPNANYQPYKIQLLSKTQPVVLSLIAIGLGIVTGLLIGIIIFFTGSHKKKDHFHDNRYWKDLPGTTFLEEQQQIQVKINQIKKFKPGIILQ